MLSEDFLQVMYAQHRGQFVERVATLLQMAGVQGRIFVHLANKCGNTITDLTAPLDESFAHDTIKEGLAILDEVKSQGNTKRKPFRYQNP